MKPINTTPKIRELRKKLNATKEILWNLLDEYYYLTNIEYSRLTYEYEMLFGELEEQINKKNNLINELNAKVQFLKNSSRTTNDKQTFQTYTKLHFNKSLTNSPAEFNEDEDKPKVPNCSVNEKYELQQLYRQLVKKIHPDIAGNSIEFQRFWNNIQDSYKSSDLLRMRIFYHTIVNSFDERHSSDNHREEIALTTELKELEQNVEKVKNRIYKLKLQEPFVLEHKLKDKFWISLQQKRLQLKLSQIDRKIKFQENILNSTNSINFEDKIFLINS
jgi:hypothetical protein